eukprot:3345496-Pleurochrysis_carterae.AAC.1
MGRRGDKGVRVGNTRGIKGGKDCIPGAKRCYFNTPPVLGTAQSTCDVHYDVAQRKKQARR